ncbi:TetR/AcrR family transcriptional regulator [Tardiphaga sp. vice352]|uniref:TetR/AcrR family transcriptional regulator n=1 Tax=unclassified Tardiphaga TaxID=2631404 RepID=UPI0011637C1E|nr:TetR/AcrR family transcriptional regulator [Tardiphaga sp. vice154]QDM26565.1 TetR/AcrR family transcriptional regulator [Tardiphaga sp. vice304]QDM31631.1 TetR/AcrR family transcriptional regulator [Tardiphaga sp. vice352]
MTNKPVPPRKTRTARSTAPPRAKKVSFKQGVDPKALVRAALEKAKAKAAASPYHHGDLRGALLMAAEKLLERDGLPGLTLRAVAREAGVSHAAPMHHFGDLSGLVSELAAIGFRNFNATMAAAGATGATPVDSALARARAYLSYARTRPGMYRLMFRTDWLDMTRPALREAANASFTALATVSGAQHAGNVATDALTMDQAAQIARNWSLVHGFTMLMLDGRLNDILRRLPEGTDAERLFVEMLKITVAKPA